MTLNTISSVATKCSITILFQFQMVVSGVLVHVAYLVIAFLRQLIFTLIKEIENSIKYYVKDNIVRTNVYHKYIKDLKLNITIDLDRFIY